MEIFPSPPNKILLDLSNFSPEALLHEAIHLLQIKYFGLNRVFHEYTYFEKQAAELLEDLLLKIKRGIPGYEE